MELIGIYLVACGLLTLAGVAKAIQPNDTARAIVQLFPGHPSFSFTRRAVRVGAVVEAAVGACALFFPRPETAALVAISYMLFVSVVAYARRHESPLSTCGCFGRPDTPATGLHVVLNVVFAASAVAVAHHPPHSTALTALLTNQPWDGVPLLLASGVGVWLTYLALSPLATLETTRRLVNPTRRKAVST